MRINRAELADLGTFLAIARHRSFRRAGLELGVSASALSHALKAIEARLGVRLINRTSRSVTLTAVGEDLLASLDAPFAAMGSALDVLNQHREPTKATGRIRLNVLEHASTLLLAPVLPLLHERHPKIEIDVRVSNDLRWMVVGAPVYLDLHGTPELRSRFWWVIASATERHLRHHGASAKGPIGSVPRVESSASHAETA